MKSSWVSALMIGVMAVGMAACADDAADETSLSAAGIQGRDAADAAGCASCHSANGATRLGPTWKGVWGSQVQLADGTTVTYDESYVETAVRDPAAQRPIGDWSQMPAYAIDVVSDEDLASIIAYIRELGGDGTTP